MMDPCPKCAYVRQPGDVAPDYECPNCGIVYAKYRPREKPSIAATNSPRPAAGRWHVRPSIAFLAGGVVVLLLAIPFLAFIFSRGKTLQSEPPSASVIAAPKPQTTKPTTPPAKTKQQLEQDRLDRLARDARMICFDAIKAKALFPSSVDIAWFTGTATLRESGATIVKAAFTSKNALGNELPFHGYCKVMDDGKVVSYAQVPR